MAIGIIADTHDDVDAVRTATGVFAEEGVETVVHCGDFVAPPAVARFNGFEVHGVLGNNDGEVPGLLAAFEELGNGSILHGRFASITLEGAHFAILHGEDREMVSAIAAGEYDYVCYGHHHERHVERVGETTVINPGAHFDDVEAEHRTVGVLEPASGDLEFYRLGP